MGQCPGGQGKRSVIRAGSIHADADRKGPALREDADIGKIDRRFRPQMKFAQKTVPVCLGFIGGGGGIDDAVPGPAEIAVVG